MLYGLIIFNSSNSYGQLGNGTTESSDKLIKIKEDVKFKKISAGEISNLTIDNEGNLWSCGENNKGQLGNGTTTNNSIPALVKADKKFIQIAAGDWHSLALDSDGTIWG